MTKAENTLPNCQVDYACNLVLTTDRAQLDRVCSSWAQSLFAVGKKSQCVVSKYYNFRNQEPVIVKNIFFKHLIFATDTSYCVANMQSRCVHCQTSFNIHFVIDLSISPSPRMQTSQWQSTISCTGSGTRTSLGFGTTEKHWKIRSLHRFYGVYASKIEKMMCLGT